jgi:hypothetical protein
MLEGSKKLVYWPYSQTDHLYRSSITTENHDELFFAEGVTKGTKIDKDKRGVFFLKIMFLRLKREYVHLFMFVYIYIYMRKYKHE